MKDIHEIYRMLHWHSHFGEQLQGIKLAREIDDLSLLILPVLSDGQSKAVWENCARALYEISDDRLEPYLPALLEWLEDLNWPGALIILDRLQIFSGEKLKKAFIDRVVYVSNSKDIHQEGLLDFLSILLANEALKAELPNEILELLQKHYDKYGFCYYKQPIV